MAELPYVSTVQVTRRLPDTLELTVTEYDVTYAAQGADGPPISSRRTARSRKRSSARARGHIAVTGLQLADPVVGQQSQSPGTMTLADAEATTRCARVLHSRRPASKKAASVAVPSSYELSFWYGDQYEVKLGNSENLPY